MTFSLVTQRKFLKVKSDVGRRKFLKLSQNELIPQDKINIVSFMNFKRRLSPSVINAFSFKKSKYRFINKLLFNKKKTYVY